MRIEVTKTLKGAKLWKKGTVFDDAVAPIPKNILKEFDSGADTVKLIGAKIATEKPIIVAVETENEIKPVVQESQVKPPDTVPVVPQEKNVISCLEELFELYPTKSSLARVLGISYQTLSRWSTGKTQPSEEAVIKIRNLLRQGKR